MTEGDFGAYDELLLAMLEEDVGEGDVTTALFDGDREVGAVFRARSEGVMCGFPFVARLFQVHDPSVGLEPLKEEGERFAAGEALISVRGRAGAILTVERTALNLFSRLCGIAAKTRDFVEAAEGRAEILDTRKTTPLLRPFEKYAVRTGGGVNHRFGLYDQVLVKDNHLTLLGGGEEDFRALVERARERYGPGMTVEIEVDTLEQFRLVLAAEPDIVLLDNMPPETMREAARLRDEHAARGGKRVLLEASGGVTLERVPAISRTGVDRISVGSLTYAPRVVDIGLDFEG